jgi:acetyltransferase
MVFDAALMRAGTVRVQTYTQLFAAARILAIGRIPRGDRLAIVSNGRGPALLAADEAALRGVTLAKFTPETVAALDAILPHTSERANPVNVRGSATPARFADAVRATLADPNVDAVVALHVARPVIGATDSARAVAAVARESGKPVLGAWLGAVNRREVDDALDAGAIANYFTPENAVDAFSFLAAYRRNQAWLLEVPPPQPAPEPPDLAVAERLRESAAREGRTRLMTGELLTLLAAFGIATPPFAIVETLAEAEAEAKRLRFPVTLALDSDEPDATAALREIRTRAALARAWGELHLSLRDLPRAGFSGRTLVRHARPAHAGLAASVGVATDAAFGPVITLGAGAAVGAAQSVMLPPLNHRLALDLVSVTFASARGVAHVGPDEGEALAHALTQVSALVCALPWVHTLELQPVMVAAGRAQVLAARAVIDPKRLPQPAYRHMAIHPYPVELVDAVTLRDGTMLRIRPIRPEDAELERAFVHGLSEQTRFFRFFYQLNELTPTMLARFTQVDYDRELALVAVAQSPQEGDEFVGVARYITNPDRESAEFAVVVADAWQGRGIARALMDRLIAAAKKRGLERLVGTVLRSNRNMLLFTAALGFRTHDDPEDVEQVVVERDL